MRKRGLLQQASIKHMANEQPADFLFTVEDGRITSWAHAYLSNYVHRKGLRTLTSLMGLVKV